MNMFECIRRRPWLVPLFALIACASPKLATGPIMWNDLQDWSVYVVTEDEDGSERSARIWIVVHEGQGAIRTGGSRWRKNIERGSSVAIRLGGLDHPVAAKPIDDLAIRREIDAEFLRKYGWQEGAFIPSDRASSDDAYLRLTPLP